MSRHRKTLKLAWPLVAACASLGVAAAAFAEDAGQGERPIERFVGTFDYAKSHDHGRAIVRAAFDEGLKQLNVITRSLARRKMAGRDPLVRSIVISEQGQKIAVRYVGEKSGEVASRPGVREKVTAPNGKSVDLTQRIRGDQLEQVFVGPKGRTRNRMTLSKDGSRLTFHSHISGESLETPIQYRLVYKRR